MFHKLLYILFFVGAFLTFLFTFMLTPSPENKILGEWKELTWEYEKVNKYENDSVRYKHIPEDVKEQIGQNLIIHKAETWEFLPNGKLKLIGKDKSKIVNWRIKGRGNILQLKYDNDTTEHYILTELDDNKMYLNFESDIQARGIAKLTFEKVKS